MSSLNSFNASVEGTTVKISPKAANTGDTDIKETLTITATGGNDATVALTQKAKSVGEVLNVKADFTSDANYPAEFPMTSKDGLKEAIAYEFNGYHYTISAADNYYGIKGAGGEYAIFFGKTNAESYIALPAIDGYKLTKAVVTEGIGVGKNVEFNIFDPSGTTAVSDVAKTIGNSSRESHTFELSSSVANTSYRIMIVTSGKNLQVGAVDLTYEPVK